MTQRIRRTVAAAALAVTTVAGLALVAPAPAQAAVPTQTVTTQAVPTQATVPTVAAARPTVDTTGVPAGRTLAPMAGGTVATTGVVSDRVIEGDVLFTGSSLTLRNVRVTGLAVFRGDNLVIESSEFGALSLSGTSNVRVSGVEVVGSAGRDGVHITSDTRRVRNVVVEDTLVRNPQVTADSHYDGFQVRGVEGLTLRRVSVELGPFQPQHNAALFLENANGGNTGVTVEDSWLAGGGYVLYSFAGDVHVRRTTFSGGRWGHLFPQSQGYGIVEFAGNTDGAGTSLGMRTSGGTYQIAAVDAADRARKTAFVTALYTDFLGRPPSVDETLAWVTRLDTGASRYDVAMSLAQTDAWLSSVITRFYRDTLGREPDAPGLAGWIRAAQSGTSVAAIASCFYGSDEYLATVARGDLPTWVTDLYGKLLFRSPDGAGLHGWLGVMSRGTSRADVALGFYQADETLRLRVDHLYRTLLGRPAEPAGLAGWAPVVRAQGDLALAAFLASSDEYYARAQQR